MTAPQGVCGRSACYQQVWDDVVRVPGGTFRMGSDQYYREGVLEGAGSSRAGYTHRPDEVRLPL
jgi:hypothetical protein